MLRKAHILPLQDKRTNESSLSTTRCLSPGAGGSGWGLVDVQRCCCVPCPALLRARGRAGSTVCQPSPFPFACQCLVLLSLNALPAPNGFAGKLVGVCKLRRKKYILYLILGQKCSGGIPKQPQMSKPNAVGSSAPPGSLVPAPPEPPDGCGVQEDPSRVRTCTRAAPRPALRSTGGVFVKRFLSWAAPSGRTRAFVSSFLLPFFFFLWLKGHIYIE